MKTTIAHTIYSLTPLQKINRYLHGPLPYMTCQMQDGATPDRLSTLPSTDETMDLPGLPRVPPT